MATLKLEIVTPEAVSFSDEVEMVVIPGAEGELGVLPQHIPLITLLKPGELRVQRQGKEMLLAVGTGIVEVTSASVSVLTDMAVSEEEIDETEAQEAADRAQRALADKATLSGEEAAAIEVALQKSLAKLALKRRKRS